MKRRDFLKLGAGLAAAGKALAQDTWPAKPVRIVLPFSPGGGTDFQARIMGDYLTRTLGQSFIIDYRPGAGSNIGVAEVARSAPDGYTLGWITVASHAINPSLYARLPFDPVRDFAFVSMVGTFPNLLVCNNDLPATNVQELISLLKKNPGRYTFASSGQGTSVHLSGELFKMLTGTDMVHVPYKGGGPALADVQGGQVHMTFGNMPTVLGPSRSGRVRALGVTSSERWFNAPEIPAIAETVPGLLAISWHAAAFAAGTPAPIVEKLAAAIHKGLGDKEVQDRLAAGGVKPTPMGPAELAAFVKEDTERWAPAIRASGARIE